MIKHSYMQDFAAGLDPTGVLSAKRAKEVRDDPKGRARAAVAGGAVSGMAIGAAIPAATAGLGALATKKWNPALSKALKDQAVASLHSLHPAKMYNYVRSLKPSMQVAESMGKAFGSAERVTKAMKGNVKHMPGVVGDTIDAVTNAAKAMKQKTHVENKYFGGKEFGRESVKGLTAITTAGASLGGAGVAGLTAHLQYKEGYKQNKYLNKNNNGTMMKQADYDAIKKAAYTDELEKISMSKSIPSLIEDVVKSSKNLKPKISRNVPEAIQKHRQQISQTYSNILKG